MSLRWDTLPAHLKDRVASSFGGPRRAPTLADQRAMNRADRIAREGEGTHGSISVPGPIPTTNDLLRMHESARRVLFATWRKIGATTTGPAVVGRVGVEVTSTADRLGGLGDASSHSLAVKALLDGMCDAGILPDDDGRFVAWERHHAPTRGRAAVMTVRLVPVEAGVSA